jgi:hypothetical protein
MSEVPYQQMTPSQLKQYLSDHRNDDEKFSLALGELMSRDIWTIRPLAKVFYDIIKGFAF